jgi:UV DNA damage endonuclease
MKIGYPCINRSIGCTTNSTFRLASYSEENLVSKVGSNLKCLARILEYNIRNGLLFFRISSDIVPFASHPVCTFDWASYFKHEFRELGGCIRENDIRVSMHPDQFVLINSPRRDVVEKSINELGYHCRVLDAMELNASAKVQIHVGGVYGNREKSVERFIENYLLLPDVVRKRLVIENDDRSYNLGDCISIHKETGVPVVFDSFHHECLNNKEHIFDAVMKAGETWQKKDGILMADYSSQEKGMRKGKHAESIDIELFEKFMRETKEIDFDIMLEIKDKEKSALKALKLLKNLNLLR